MAGKERVVELESAGGVVYRPGRGQIEVAVCGRLEPSIQGLPKGTPEPGETREETALREVREETGLQVEIRGYVASIEYSFVRPGDGARCHKIVRYYLMSPIGGDLALHDHEFDEVRWLPADEAIRALTYANEAEVVEKGLSLVAETARLQ